MVVTIGMPNNMSNPFQGNKKIDIELTPLNIHLNAITPPDTGQLISIRHHYIKC